MSQFSVVSQPAGAGLGPGEVRGTQEISTTGFASWVSLVIAVKGTLCVISLLLYLLTDHLRAQ